MTSIQRMQEHTHLDFREAVDADETLLARRSLNERAVILVLGEPHLR